MLDNSIKELEVLLSHFDDNKPTEVSETIKEAILSIYNIREAALLSLKEDT